jgi:hypothetical protein
LNKKSFENGKHEFENCGCCEGEDEAPDFCSLASAVPSVASAADLCADETIFCDDDKTKIPYSESKTSKSGTEVLLSQYGTLVLSSSQKIVEYKIEQKEF